MCITRPDWPANGLFARVFSAIGRRMAQQRWPMAEDPRLFCLHFISHWTESLVRSRYVLRAQKYHVMVLMVVTTLAPRYAAGGLS